MWMGSFTHGLNGLHLLLAAVNENYNMIISRKNKNYVKPLINLHTLQLVVKHPFQPSLFHHVIQYWGQNLAWPPLTDNMWP